MTERTLEQLNNTPLSLAVAKLTEPEYQGTYRLDLSSALAEYLEECLTDRENPPTRYYRYIMERAQETLDWMERNRNPEETYKRLTEYPPTEVSDEDERSREEEFLEIATTEDPEYTWTLGNLCQEILETLQLWYNLEPEFPELL